jgi:drug/metabolite transporter (DMT)-like permease
MIAVAFGLLSALAWGAADFTGGLASRKTGAFRVVLFGGIVGMTILVPAALTVGDTIPNVLSWMQAALAGALGTLGLLMLYHALAIGTMSIAAPVSALMATILPVVIGAFSEGVPGRFTSMGFGLALMAIWLVSQNESAPRNLFSHLADLRLPLLSGIGFGSYFVLMHSAAQESTVWPMVASRGAGLLVIGLFILTRRDSLRVPRNAWSIIVVNGLLDVVGNAFFILAGQTGRLDISSVLSSLYPGATILLAWFILRERLSSTQWAGIGAALIAIILFTV